MNTHKIVDAITNKTEFIGTFDECSLWKIKKTFGYKIEVLSAKEELIYYNKAIDEVKQLKQVLHQTVKILINVCPDYLPGDKELTKLLSTIDKILYH